MRIILTILCLLLAGPASGATDGVWQRGCTDTTRTTTGLDPGEWACWEPDTNTDESPILSVAQCENYTIKSFDDKDGDGTVCTVAATVEMCPGSAADLTTDTIRNNACAQEPGTTTLSGDDSEIGYDSRFIRVNLPGSGTNVGDCQYEVHCAQGPGR